MFSQRRKGGTDAMAKKRRRPGLYGWPEREIDSASKRIVGIVAVPLLMAVAAIRDWYRGRTQ
jgi:hypothetical protein